MSKRIIEISSDGNYLKVQHKQLTIQREHSQISSVPIEDLAALIIDHPQTRISQVLLADLLTSNVMVVISDRKHQPTGMLLPLQHHVTQTEKFAAQVALAKSRKKQLWKQIVQNKIRQQSWVLKSVSDNDAGLSKLVQKVKSGDSENVEAQAARRYWTRLFTGNFKRDREADDQNRFLNYCYAIVRALTARCLCASGLHPSLGLHHHNRYSAYCLADDMMEPYRAFADIHVYEILKEYPANAELNQEIRMRLLQISEYKIPFNGEMLSIQTSLQKTAQSLARIIAGEPEKLALPD